MINPIRITSNEGRIESVTVDGVEVTCIKKIEIAPIGPVTQLTATLTCLVDLDIEADPLLSMATLEQWADKVGMRLVPKETIGTAMDDGRVGRFDLHRGCKPNDASRAG